jgi:hypothetical protein
MMYGRERRRSTGERAIFKPLLIVTSRRDPAASSKRRARVYPAGHQLDGTHKAVCGERQAL